MTRPLIGLLVRPDVPDAVVTLLTRLQRWADVRAASGGSATPTAYVATAPDALGIEKAAGTGRPLAIWVDSVDHLEVARAVATPATVFVTAAPAVGAALEPETIVMPAEDDGASELVPRSPFVRRRWRLRAGFPADWTVTIGGPRSNATLPADDPLVPTALAMAAAAFVVGPSPARQGLASGCPMVIDAESAEALGVVDGVHALVHPAAPGRRPLLTALVEDAALAAALSRSGRTLFDRQHDLTSSVQRIATHLGLVPDDTDRPLGRLDATLDTLHTPDHSRARHRAHELLDGLPMEAAHA